MVTQRLQADPGCQVVSHAEILPPPLFSPSGFNCNNKQTNKQKNMRFLEDVQKKNNPHAYYLKFVDYSWEEKKNCC